MSSRSRTAFRAYALNSIALSALAAAWAAPSTAQTAPGAGGGEDIVVTGQRLSTAHALDEKKAAIGVTDVISADDLGKLPDATVADSLGRIPGVSVIVNQDTGEGEYVTVRGLSGTYNAVTINGVRAAQTDPSSRDVSLNVLPPYGLAGVTVTKTLTPDQDGDAIGGTIDFRTPTAFDFKDKTTVRLYGSGGFNDRAKSADLPSVSYQAQADLAHRFADDRFGVFVSGNYSVSHGDGQETENDGEWEPNSWRADSMEPIDQSNMHLPGIDLDFRRIKQTRYGGNLSFDFHGDHTQLYLRGQFSRQEMRGSNDTTDYNNSRTPRLNQVNVDDKTLAQPDKVIIGHDPVKGNIYGYTTKQIVDEDGDNMITDADRTTSGYWSLNGRSGIFDPEAFYFARNFSSINQNQTLGTADLGGHSDLGRLHLDYDASYSGGQRGSPDSYSISYRSPADLFPFNATGITWVSADPRFPQPGLPPFAQGVDHEPQLLQFDGASHDRDKQTDSRIAFKLDGKYDVGGLLDYVKVGGKFTRSHRVYDYTPIWSGDFSGTPLDGLNLAQSGLILREVNSTLRGEYYYGAIYNAPAVESAINNAQTSDPSGLPSATDMVSSDNKSTEKIYAGYALAHFQAKALQVITGVRVERRETLNIFWKDDGDNSGFDSTSNAYNVVLPSITAILRPSDKQVYRAAIWTGYSPPEFGYLSGGESVGRDPGTNEIVSISRGNPDLKAARAVNFDVSAEYYPDRTSVVSAAAYYKSIRNFIFTNGSSVAAENTQGSIDITQPQNGKDAYIYGIEFDLIKNFQGLIAPFDGFGFEGNLTLQHSRGDTGLAYRMGHKIPLINTPSVLYNAAITWQKYGFETKLSYNYRGKYIESLRDNAVDKWVQHNRSLDFHSRYNINKKIAVDFDVSNLLNDWKYYTTKGDNPAYQKDYMEPGRNFVGRVSVLF